MKQLRSPAPPDLVARVLDATGPADAWVQAPSPAGPVLVAFGEQGVSLVLADADLDELARQVRRRFDRRLVAAGAPPAGLLPALRTGRGRGVAVDLRGRSPFEREVLAAAARIPAGEVRSYGWVAAVIGRPSAVRAVGSALGRNPVPLLVPCHRVVRGDGHVGDYVFGGDRKRTLLASEGVDLDRVAAFGSRLTGSATTRIFCTPSCKDARRTRAQNERVFAGPSAALAAGYRPCRHCDPMPAPS